MCGRYTLIKLSSFLDYFSWIEQPTLFPEARYNVAPSQSIAVVTNQSAPPKIEFVRWGLVPSWAKDASIAAGSRMINARSESLAAKPAFRRLLQKQRCLIPADGFYEWQKNPGGKTPFRFGLKAGRPFAFAGLFDSWQSPDGQELRTCTIITTAANALVKICHDRMPVILKDQDCQRWISPGELGNEEVTKILSPYPADQMTGHPVSSRVNNVKNEGPELIQPEQTIQQKPQQQLSLFP